MATIKKYRKRQFLNDKAGMAAMQVSFYNNVYTSKKKDGTTVRTAYIDAAVSISDCSQTISLEFGAYTEKKRALVIRKIGRMIAELEKLELMLAEAEIAESKASYDIEDTNDEL